MVAVFLIVRRKVDDGGDNDSDLDKVGVGWLAVLTSKSSQSDSKSVESSSGNMESDLAYRSGCEWPVGVC